MKVSVEKLDGQMAKLTVEIEPAVFEEACETVYKKQRGRISIPGFRKGKAPRALIEKMYGPEVFYEDAADIVIENEYPKAYDESGEAIVSRPSITITKMAKGEPFVFEATVALRPEVTLGKYSGVTVTRQDVSVSDEEIEEDIKRALKRNARTIDVTDRAVQTDDTANIDYCGKLDGIPFDGGTAEGHDLKIGSGAFIPGFEDQVIGHKVGEEFDINVSFPEEYHAPDLAGKAVVFTVKINSIKAEELPELNDEYVQDTTEFDNVKDYRKSVKESIEKRKELQAKRTKQEEAIEKIVADSKMDIPEAMLDTQVETMFRDYTNGMRRQGIPMEQYFQMTGTNPDMLREQMRPDAEKQIKASLVLEEIAKAENFEATDKDIEDRIAEMAAMYGLKSEDIADQITDSEKERIRKEIKVEKAADFVVENCKERAKTSKKKKEDEE